MFINQTESNEFLQSLKQAGVTIQNEREVTERLAEAGEWHYAFRTLVNAGKRIGIHFAPATPIQSQQLDSVFAQFRFNRNDATAFEAALQG